jgi:hypothetical protein
MSKDRSWEVCGRTVHLLETILWATVDCDACCRVVEILCK